jgi:tetratricopeptide (TPR) repeat protein
MRASSSLQLQQGNLNHASSQVALVSFSKVERDSAFFSQGLLVRLTQLNNAAMSYAAASQFDEAAQCLGGALSLIDISIGSSYINSCCRANIKDDMVTEASEESTIEYDEGFNTFSSLAQFYPANSKEEKMLVLLYNLGQVMLLQCPTSTKKAYGIFKHALQLASTLPSKDPHALMIPLLHRIGYIQYREKAHEEAIQTFEKALDYCELLDLDELQLAATLNCLGVLYFFHPEQEDIAMSLDFQLKALSIQRLLLGNSHPTVATTLNNIGRVHFTADRLDLALVAYNEALRIRRAVFGAGHPDVAATIYNTGQTLHQKGDMQLALEYYQEFVSLAELNPGWPRGYLVVVLKYTALIHYELRQFDQALSYFQEALQVGRTTCACHPEVALIFNKLGNLHYEKGSLDDAIEMYSQGLQVEREIFPENHPNIIVTLSNIGQIYKQKGDLDSALPLYEEALQLQREAANGVDPNIAVTLSNIGMIHYQTGRYTKALESYQEALSIRRDALGEDNLEVASSLNSLGLVLFKLGLHSIALQSFTESLRIRQSLLGGAHRDVAIILYNIATIQFELGDEDGAMRFYKETLRVETAVLGPDHGDVGLTLQTIAKIHKQRGELDHALELYEQVLRIQRHNNMSTTDPCSVAATLKLIAELRLLSGDVAGVVEAMSEAERICKQAGRDDQTELSGFDLYCIAKLHPEAAAAA